MGPVQGDRDHARVKAKNKAVEVRVEVAVMELARAATAFVRIAVRKLRTSRALPVLI
jgi:hypothetical protein